MKTKRVCKTNGHLVRVKWARIIGMIESAAIIIENALEDAPENDELEMQFINVADALAVLQEAVERATGGRIDREADGEVA